VIFACRCGDGKVGCSEQCDDGNNVNGDGCDQACRTE
jgi:proprotein convertase subtilisin/kexin type 5